MNRADFLGHQRNEADRHTEHHGDIVSRHMQNPQRGHERPQRIGKRRRRGGEHQDEAAEDKQDHPNAVEAAQRESHLVVD